jgi:WXG100 family type VII secretion target
MADKIQMDYEAVQQMAQIAKQSADELDEMIGSLKAITDQLDGGALIGRAGRALADGIGERLVPAVGRLSQKFSEISLDLLGALTDLRDSDSQAGGLFGR